MSCCWGEVVVRGAVGGGGRREIWCGGFGVVEEGANIEATLVTPMVIFGKFKFILV